MPDGPRDSAAGEAPAQAPNWAAYLTAVIASLAVVFLRHVLTPWAQDRPMMILYILPILLAGYLGGLGPGFLATALVCLTAGLFLGPSGYLLIEHPIDMIHWTLLLICGIAISAISESLRRHAPDGALLTRDRSAPALRRTFTGFGVALALLGTIGMVSLASIGKLQHSLAVVQQSFEALDTLKAVVATTVDVETSQRGYVLTGDESYLEPYSLAVGSMDSMLSELKVQFSSDSKQGELVAKLTDLLRARIAQVERVIEVRRSQGAEEARALIASGEGRRLQDSIRSTAEALRRYEVGNLNDHQREADFQGNLCKVVIAAGCALAFAFVAVAFYLISIDFAETRRAQAALREAHRTLEERVAERTRELDAALETIRNSEGRLAGIVNSAMDAIISVDAQGKVVLFNRAAEAMFRCPDTEALGRTLDQFLPADIRGRHHGQMADFGKTGKTTRSMGGGRPLRAVRMDGTEFPIEASISQVVVGGQKVFTVILRDVTDRLVAEESIRKLNTDLMARNAELDAERARWKGILESIADEVWVCDREGRFTLINRPGMPELALEEVGEATAEEIHEVFEVLNVDGTPRPVEEAPLIVALEGRTVRGEEILVNRSKGIRRWRHFSAGPIHDAEGRIIGSVAVGRDITEQHEAQEALRDRDRQIARLAENIPGMVARLDRELRFLYASSPWERFFPKPIDGVVRHTIAEVLGPSAIEPSQVALTGKRTDYALEVHRADGSSHFLVSLVPEVGSGESVDGVTVLLSDITEIRKAEAALRASEVQLRALVEQAPVEIAMFDRNMICLANSRRWLEVYGRGRATIVGLCHYDVHPDLPAHWREIHCKGLAGEQLGCDEERWVRGDGVEQWMRWAVHPWYDAQGAIGGIMMLAQDITERKLAEERLRASELRYRRLVDNMREGFQIFSHNWEYLYLNDAAVGFSRRSRESMMGRRVQECFPGIETLPLFAAMERSMLERIPVTAEDEFRYPNGESAWYWLSIQPCEEGISVLSLDVTARKFAERELKASEQRYRSLLDNMSEGFQLIDGDWRYRYMNDAAIRHARLPREALLGRTMEECYPGFEASPLFAQLKQCAERRVGLALENGFVYPDGEKAWFWLSIQPADGGIAILSQDVTARKRAEEQLIQLNHDLELRVAERTAALTVSNQELEAFAYSVSHDLRTPLRAIDGFSRILAEDYGDRLDAEGHRLLSVVRTNAHQMDELISDLLSLSRVSRTEMNFESVDMEDLVAGAYQELGILEDLTGFDFECGPLPPAWGDRALLRQVWRNLLSNAVKYTRPAPVRRIRVTGSCDAQGLCSYSVTDSGVGYNPMYAHKLFRVFQRLHKAPEFEGNGIGLALIQRIARRHGGDATATGAVNQGATFTFTILSRGER